MNPRRSRVDPQWDPSEDETKPVRVLERSRTAKFVTSRNLNFRNGTASCVDDRIGSGAQPLQLGLNLRTSLGPKCTECKRGDNRGENHVPFAAPSVSDCDIVSFEPQC